MSKRSDARPARERLRLVAFDMDGVLIDHISSWAAVHESLGTENSQAVEAFKEGRIDDREFILEDVRLWRRARPAFGRKDLRRILADLPRMRGFAEAVADVRASGALCAIISGGLREMADILATEAEFSHIRANGVVFGRDGRLVDQAIVDVPLREKGSVLRSIQEGTAITPAQTAAVGDSLFDLGLFQQSAVSVAFNPLDEHVAAGATHVVRGKDLRRAVARILDGASESR